jgi:hypothetical protein
VIFAPDTTAPLGSFTTPRSEVVAIWAMLVAVTTSENTSTATEKQRLVTFPPKRLKRLRAPRRSAHLFCFCDELRGCPGKETILRYDGRKFKSRTEISANKWHGINELCGRH